MKRNFVLTALLFCLVIFSVTPVLADDPTATAVPVPLPIYVGTRITCLPYIINEPGFYYLGSNLSCLDANGITVNCDDVTIDLMGFCLTGTNQGNGSNYSAIFMDGRTNVEVRNGCLTGWCVGVYDLNFNGTGNRAVNLRMRNGNWGTFLGSNCLIKDCISENMGCHGFALTNGKIIGCIATNCGYAGINLYGPESYPLAIGAGTISGNTITCNSGQRGIVIAGTAAGPILVDQNCVTGAGTHYIDFSGRATWGLNAGR